jgi:uncharacterized membrane-anchored protein
VSPALRKGLIVAMLHVAIVSALGAKLLVDRATRPRVWVRTGPVDPDLPIRGRYVSLQIEVEPRANLGGLSPGTLNPVALRVDESRLVAEPSRDSRLFARAVPRNGGTSLVLIEPLAYFIPEHVADPSRRRPGEELWVEVTVPASGAPRPIRLGVRKDGVLTPLELK